MEKLILKQINEINKYFITNHILYVKYDWTEDKTIFCQIGVNNYSVYIEIFFSDDFKNVDEAIINLYKDKKSVYNYGGALTDCLNHIDNLLIEK